MAEIMANEAILQRAMEYAARHGVALGDPLGFGVHGSVFVLKSQHQPGRTALKVHERERSYLAERDVYLRLQESRITEIRGCHVPQLIRYDDELWGIEMTVVSRPYLLDFAGAYLDRPPDYSPEVWAQWRADKQEQFAESWGEVLKIIRALEVYGIYLADVSPSNVAVPP